MAKPVEPTEHGPEIIAALRRDFFLIADGHSIVDPEFYITRGLPTEFVARYNRVHRSDGTHKGSLTNTETGNPIANSGGVYTLEMLWGVARSIGADVSHANKLSGRGFQARALIDAIRARVDAP